MVLNTTDRLRFASNHHMYTVTAGHMSALHQQPALVQQLTVHGGVCMTLRGAVGLLVLMQL
jgi:hypothetical protein